MQRADALLADSHPTVFGSAERPCTTWWPALAYGRRVSGHRFRTLIKSRFGAVPTVGLPAEGVRVCPRPVSLMSIVDVRCLSTLAVCELVCCPGFPLVRVVAPGYRPAMDYLEITGTGLGAAAAVDSWSAHRCANKMSTQAKTSGAHQTTDTMTLIERDRRHEERRLIG